MKFADLLSQPFTLLDQIKYRLFLIFICTGFGILFLNLFVPFNINQWGNTGSLPQFVRLSSFAAFAGAIITISQLIIRPIAKVKYFKVYSFALWFLGEVFLTTCIIILFEAEWDISFIQFLKDIPSSFKLILLGLLVPYSIALLFISLIVQNKELDKLHSDVARTEFEDELIDFSDEKGILRFSLLGGQLLYLESADNYVMVYYLSNGKREKKCCEIH